MHFRKHTLIILLWLIGVNLFSQEIAIGEWRDHLPYSNCVAVAEAENRIYCSTLYNLFYYDKTDNSITRITKISGLSDIGINTIDYNTTTKTLVVAYTNTNIDLIQDRQVINISDIKRKSILGNKTINKILFIDEFAYMACGFGIVVLDLKREEIKDTYYIGPGGSQIDVLDLAFDGQIIYAATENGIFSAPINSSNLANFESWSKNNTVPYPDSKYNIIEVINGKVIINYSTSDYNSDTVFVYSAGNWIHLDTSNTSRKSDISIFGEKVVITSVGDIRIYDSTLTNYDHIWTYNPGFPSPQHAIIDKDDLLWIADKNEGLVKNRNIWSSTKIKLNGPQTKNSLTMSLEGNKLWVATGGKDMSWNNLWMIDGVFAFEDEQWTTHNSKNTPLMDSLRDFMSVAVNPSNPTQVFVGTWGNGIMEFSNGVYKQLYNSSNSSLSSAISWPGWIGVAGITFDQYNNLWATNSGNPNALSARINGEWKSFSLSPVISEDAVGGLMIDSYNQKWIIMPRGQGLVVFNDNNSWDNSADDKKIRLSTAIGNGALPSNNVVCMAEDKDGEVWVGTDKGIAVFYSPENIFSGFDFDAQQILVEQDGIVNYLLESETVTTITVDGSNKKWIGTQRGGVFLMSEDGTKQIYHFTEENSPLFSNTIICIEINDETGEVFFGTNNGIISFKGKATEGGEKHNNVYAYPNPVKENYNGYIAIKGLVQNSDVKITDIGGTLIFKTIAEGGQAVWNGKNFDGKRAQSGVYLVFSSNSDGSETLVTKILFIN
ncbi:two-component regulator propeller domain-containing protein [Bacteroidota bacterium]